MSSSQRQRYRSLDPTATAGINDVCCAAMLVRDQADKIQPKTVVLARRTGSSGGKWAKQHFCVSDNRRALIAHLDDRACFFFRKFYFNCAAIVGEGGRVREQIVDCFRDKDRVGLDRNRC